MEDKREKPSKFEWVEGDLFLLDKNQEERQEETNKDEEDS